MNKVIISTHYVNIWIIITSRQRVRVLVLGPAQPLAPLGTNVMLSDSNAGARQLIIIFPELLHVDQ